MWTFFLICAIISIIGLLYYLVLLLNETEQSVLLLAEKIKKHYDVTT